MISGTGTLNDSVAAALPPVLAWSEARTERQMPVSGESGVMRRAGSRSGAYQAVISSRAAHRPGRSLHAAPPDATRTNHNLGDAPSDECPALPFSSMMLLKPCAVTLLAPPPHPALWPPKGQN